RTTRRLARRVAGRALPAPWPRDGEPCAGNVRPRGVGPAPAAAGLTARRRRGTHAVLRTPRADLLVRRPAAHAAPLAGCFGNAFALGATRLPHLRLRARGADHV